MIDSPRPKPTGKLRDLTGQVFGELTVIEKVERKGRGNARWLCKCSCGVMTIGASNKLTLGYKRSCGAMEHRVGCKIVKLGGKKFGKLTVKEYCGLDARGHALWNCECECGGEKICRSLYLTKGANQNCGNRVQHPIIHPLYEDLVGMRFGLLTVAGAASRGTRGELRWDCICDCGNTKVLSSSAIGKMGGLSCGDKKHHKDRRGTNHWAWIPDLDPQLRIDRRWDENNKNWRREVYERDGFKCVLCESNKNIEAHHLASFTRFPDLRYEIDNGVTLCRAHHKEFHSSFGIYKFTAEDFQTFARRFPDRNWY